MIDVALPEGVPTTKIFFTSGGAKSVGGAKLNVSQIPSGLLTTTLSTLAKPPSKVLGVILAPELLVATEVVATDFVFL